MDEGDEEEVDEEEPETVKGWGPSTMSAGGKEQVSSCMALLC
jgi:hypothetical protein